MLIDLTPEAEKQSLKLPTSVKKAFKKQLYYLEENPRHPSLDVKLIKAQGFQFFQARVNRKYRFYFEVKKDWYVINSIIPHPK